MVGVGVVVGVGVGVEVGVEVVVVVVVVVVVGVGVGVVTSQQGIHMSTYLASSEPKHKSGPFTAFTATSKYPTTYGRTPRVAVDGDPFFFTLRSLRMAINRLSSQSYPFLLNTQTNTIESGYRMKEPHFRPLTPDDFNIEAHLYTPQTIPIVDHTYAGKTTPAEALGIQEPHP